MPATFLPKDCCHPSYALALNLNLSVSIYCPVYLNIANCNILCFSLEKKELWLVFLGLVSDTKGYKQRRTYLISEKLKNYGCLKWTPNILWTYPLKWNWLCSPLAGIINVVQPAFNKNFQKKTTTTTTKIWQPTYRLAS